MRIVYDDKMCAAYLGAFYAWIASVNAQTLLNAERRVDLELVRESMNAYAKKYHFEISKKATHAYNIGNNNSYPVYYSEGGEKQICAYFNCNLGLYGEAFLYVTDYEDAKKTRTFEMWHGEIKG